MPRCGHATKRGTPCKMKQPCRYHGPKCAICWSPGDLMTTPCGHRFHQTCIDEWTSRGNRTCPSCRGIIAETTYMAIVTLVPTNGMGTVFTPPPLTPRRTDELTRRANVDPEEYESDVVISLTFDDNDGMHALFDGLIDTRSLIGNQRSQTVRNESEGHDLPEGADVVERG